MVPNTADNNQGHRDIASFSPGAEYLNNIFKDVPEKLQQGSVLIDNGDFKFYLSVMILTIIIFFIMFTLITRILSYIEGEAFTRKDNDVKVWRVGTLCTLIHHLVIITSFTYTFYNSCSNKQGLPYPTTEGGTYTSLTDNKRWGFYMDESCFVQPNKGYAITLIFSIGFSLFDLYLMCYWIHSSTKLIKQTIFHHVCMILGILAALGAGYWTPGLAACALYSEISSVFLNMMMLIKSKEEGRRGQVLLPVVQLLFFVTYTVFRIALFPWILY